MDLRDYPRPKGDTGIGVHWNAGFPAAVGLGDIRDKWLPELIAMGVKWVKLARHDGGVELAELFLKHDIMPIVRVYRPQPNPGTLDTQALRLVRDHVSAGVRYFEFNNEPDLPTEWTNEKMPPNALEVVAQNAIVDIEAILQAGGYPGLPAMTVGSKWDLVGEICRLGRRDLLAEPIWQAIHNYSLNHPLDYPYDPGNLQGAPYTEEFYTRLATEAWDGSAWGGWSLERVNEERRLHANPGATAFDDPSCWRAYERYDSLIRDQIGRSLPILATENGYIVGERPDPRYPATTPLLHMAQTLEACRIMMGTSTRFDHAPDYYFCTAFWLLGNYTLGHWAPAWEGQAWYSGRWPNGQLPIVAALKAEPKQARGWRGDSSLSGHVSGRVVAAEGAGAGLTVRLEREDGWALVAHVRADGRFEFADLPLRAYRVILPEAGREKSVTLTRENPAATVDFDLTGASVVLRDGVIRGTVRGGAGMKVGLARPADGWAQQQVVAADGSYRFAGLRAGTYVLALIGTEVARADIAVDGRSEVVVDLALPGWGWTVADGGASPGFGIVRCRVTGRPDMAVRLWTVGWPGMVARTGTKPEYGPDVCEFAPLGAGVYSIQPEGTDVIAQVTVDGSRVLWVTFTETPTAAARESAIVGRVVNGAGKVITLTGPDTERTSPAANDGSFSFTGLGPGIYRVEVSGTDVARDDLVLDGHNRVTVELTLPVTGPAAAQWSVEDAGPGPGFSIVRCRAGEPGRDVRLWTSGWSGIVQRSGSKAEYGPDACEFSPLGPGSYFVELVDRGVRADVKVEPNRVVWVRFAPATPSEPSPTEPGPVEPTPPPQQSVVTGAVVNGEGFEVVLSGPGGDRRTSVAGGRYRFEGLPAGTYRLAVLAPDPAVGEVAARGDIVLDGTNTRTVDFELAAIGPADSTIVGKVKGGVGRTILLEGPDGLQLSARVGADETYRFVGLPAGTYRATLQDTDPPSGSTQTHSGIELDGTNTVQLDFDLEALVPAKTFDHYLLVGTQARSKEDFLAVLRYVARFQPRVGTEAAEAQGARHVTILGGVSSVSALVEQGLRMSGCQVHRIEADYAGHLGRLLDEGRPY